MISHGEDIGHLRQHSILQMAEKRFSVRVLQGGLDVFQEFAAVAAGKEPSLKFLDSLGVDQWRRTLP